MLLLTRRTVGRARPATRCLCVLSLLHRDDVSRHALDGHNYPCYERFGRPVWG
jgi:hypothetical protein